MRFNGLDILFEDVDYRIYEPFTVELETLGRIVRVCLTETLLGGRWEPAHIVMEPAAAITPAERARVEDLAGRYGI